MDWLNMASLQGMLFALILLGVYARKRGIIPSDARKHLSNLLIDVVLPMNIISSFEVKFSGEVAMGALTVLIVSLGTQVISLLYSMVLYRKIPWNRQVVLRYATIVSNAGFLGLPIAQVLYGAQGGMYAAVALIPIRIFMWTVGLSLFTSTDKKAAVKQLLVHPCMVAVWIGFVVMLLPFELPSFLSKAISSVGNATTAVSMLIIGGILADTDVRSAVNKEVLYFSLVRLILIPLTVYAILKPLGVDPLVTGVAVVFAAMPAGSTTAILAARHDGDATFASKVVFVSTVLSLVTIPALGLLPH